MIIKASAFNKRICIMLIIFFILLTGCDARTLEVKQQAAVEPVQMDPGLSPNLDKIMDNIHSVSSYKRRIGSQGDKDTATFLHMGIRPRFRYFPMTYKKNFPLILGILRMIHFGMLMLRRRRKMAKVKISFLLRSLIMMTAKK